MPDDCRDSQELPDFVLGAAPQPCGQEFETEGWGQEELPFGQMSGAEAIAQAHQKAMDQAFQIARAAAAQICNLGPEECRELRFRGYRRVVRSRPTSREDADGEIRVQFDVEIVCAWVCCEQG